MSSKNNSSKNQNKPSGDQASLQALKSCIIYEYVCVAIGLAIVFFVIPNWINSMPHINMGTAVMAGASSVIFRYAVLAAFCVINPTRIVVTYKKELFSIKSNKKRAIIGFLIIFPIIMIMVMLAFVAYRLR